ncbi:MAG: molybdopterin-dependent oxidoreductase [Chloroflexota bacterium]|nr:molybdopterin-dependent oxidoreductase [Chloroflexota bacterium]
MHTNTVNRRRLMQGSGGLLVTFSLAAAFRQLDVAGQEATPTVAPELPEASVTPTVEPGLVATPENQTHQDVQTRNVTGDTVDSWLEIDASGDVTVYSGKVELGTGLRTALSQIVAEELDVPFARITMIMGDTALTPDQGTTAGSKSIQVAGPVLRQAAAEARLILLTRASERLGVPADDLQVKEGVVSAPGDESASVPYGELVAEPFEREVTGEAPEKPPASYVLVGESIDRVDIPPKLTGGEAYVQDIRLDGMLHGRVVRPYVRTMEGIGATLENFDDSAAREMPGVVQVVRNGNFIGVVAEREEQAVAAAEAIEAEWTFGDPLPALNQIHDLLREMPLNEDEGGEIVRTGDVEGALEVAPRTLEATYRFASQAHAMMGPSCAVADVRPDGATIYTQSQNVFNQGRTLADLLGLAPEQVHTIHREGSGCYGHSGFDDAAADAAILSQAVGRPVRVQWMRADEFAWEPKGPPMTMDLRGGLDDEGNILAWDYEVWTPTHNTRPSDVASKVLAGQLIDPPAPMFEVGYGGGDRNAPTNYSFPNYRVTVHWVETPPLRPSALRSLGGLPNATTNELFMDEMATAAGADPVEFRLRHLYDPRAIDVIRAAAEKAGWDARPSGPGATPVAGGGLLTGRGIAFARYETEYAYAAVVAEVEVDPGNGNVRVTRVVVGHDCGLIINPDGLTNQLEGNVIQGTSRALKEEVTWDDKLVTSLDWSGYHILTFPEVPVIEVALIDRPEEDALGAGEPAICPVPAAIGNAIFDATGARMRVMPFTPERVLEALATSPNA